MTSRLQNYLGSEFLASGLSTEFYDLITKVTQAKSKTEEASTVLDELSGLNLKLGAPDVSSTRMRDYLIRLIHCYMLGYDVNFSIIYAIMTSQSGDNASDRRVENDHELGIMLINTLQRDLKSQEYLDKCAALNAICYLQYNEMMDNVLDLVIQCMDFPKQIVRKKAVMALYFLYKTANDERVENSLRRGLEDKDQSVVFAALSVWRMLLEEHASRYEELLSTFYSIHEQIIEKRIHKSFLYHGVLAPWAQLECLGIYKIYQGLNIGSPQEYYNMISRCLKSVEKKVDAGFAIILECIKLLSAIEPIMLRSFSSPDENPFEILSVFLTSPNHNLQSLGLVGMSFVDRSFWMEDWLNGSLLSHIIKRSFDDDTIITQAIDNLETIVDNNMILKEITENSIEALSRNYDENKQCNMIVGYWLINRLMEYGGVQPDIWFIESAIKSLAETRKNLDYDYVESQFSVLKEILTEETDVVVLRESAVDTLYSLLKKTNSDHFSPFLLQFAFWALGENGWLSQKYSEIQIMEQLMKWVMIAQDDYLQICALQAIRACILRSRTWLSELEKILKEFKTSPILEKQEISRELLALLKDRQFEKQLQETTLMEAARNTSPSVNPNRPDAISKFSEVKNKAGGSERVVKEAYNTGFSEMNNKSEESYYEQNVTSRQQRDKTKHKPKPDSISFSITTGNSLYRQSPENSDLISSLIELELNEKDDFSTNQLTTEEFGKHWVEYKFEKRKKMNCNIQKAGMLAKILGKLWHLSVIQVIGQEFIAVNKSTSNSDILVHVTLLPASGEQQQFELTVKSNKSLQELGNFLSEKQEL